ncbi:DUF4199 domain-containing protein [Pedobacter sp. V48]|uniref:DUF4199 domain-containing protein n=1 Tax=Pedobacter sp. V48 TaxID=509635 RepID=UPI0003E543E9|nr:DUF4199 domain-containing protein [Pedobacter sp. V48]ETZ23359.1 hypothetical protein N824_18015 [Pedobacter sp. V48]
MEEIVVEPKKNPNMLAFKSAIAYSVYFLVLMFVMKWLGVDQNNPNTSVAEKIIYSLASYIPFIMAVVFVQTTYKKELGGYISFGKAFSSGFKVAAYAGLFIAVFTILYYKVLDTNAFNQLMDSAKAAAGDDENKVKGVEMMRPYMIFFIGFGVAVSYTLYGLIISLIGAAVIKKEQPLYEE